MMIFKRFATLDNCASASLHAILLQSVDERDFILQQQHHTAYIFFVVLATPPVFILTVRNCNNKVCGIHTSTHTLPLLPPRTPS
jgi:hypothetical protein